MDPFWIGFLLMMVGAAIAGILPEYIVAKPENRVFFYVAGTVTAVFGALLSTAAVLRELPATL